MADFYPEPPLFKGTNPEECEVLVATIRRQALERGKQNDNEWVALFASSYLIGDALYWYEDLEESIQKDWSRLRPALLARFGRKGLPTTVTSAALAISSSPSTTIPTPAAAPATTSHSKKGYVKVLNLDGSLNGYLAGAITRSTGTKSTNPPPSKQGGQSPKTSSMIAAIRSIGSTRLGGPASSGQGLTSGVKPTAYIYRARALYASRFHDSYPDTASPDDPNEISFSKGETLEIVDNSSRWWQARKQDGRTGIAPS
ncbi:Transmembrane osmosensor, partial [Tulasnella sp. UAMH 9824]